MSDDRCGFWAHCALHCDLICDHDQPCPDYYPPANPNRPQSKRRRVLAWLRRIA